MLKLQVLGCGVGNVEAQDDVGRRKGAVRWIRGVLFPAGTVKQTTPKEYFATVGLVCKQLRIDRKKGNKEQPFLFGVCAFCLPLFFSAVHPLFCIFSISFFMFIKFFSFFWETTTALKQMPKRESCASPSLGCLFFRPSPFPFRTTLPSSWQRKKKLIHTYTLTCTLSFRFHFCAIDFSLFLSLYDSTDDTSEWGLLFSLCWRVKMVTAYSFLCVFFFLYSAFFLFFCLCVYLWCVLLSPPLSRVCQKGRCRPG